jgi:hypothetical protein
MAQSDMEGTVELGELTHQYLVDGLRAIVTSYCSCPSTLSKTRRKHGTKCPAARAVRALRDARRAAEGFRR